MSARGTVSLKAQTDDVEDAKRQPSSATLTVAQRERIERNRERARLLRASRLVRPYPERTAGAKEVAERTRAVELIDTGGGFLLEPEDEESSEQTSTSRKVVWDPPAILSDQPVCEDCGKAFGVSYIFTHFHFALCDGCRDAEKHPLISRTDVKKEFLLKDCDLDGREPPLPYLLRRNPHSRFGEMKLYFKLQVERRALEVWGSTEAMENERDKKAEAREQRKQEKLNKQVKELRKSVLTSTWRKDSAPHQHTFPASSEVYNEDSDDWTKTCSSCGYSITFEKM